MTIFRMHPDGLAVILIHRETGDLRWAPVNEGEWMKIQDHSEFNKLDDGIAGELHMNEVLWLRDNCKCDTKTCGPCSKYRVGVPPRGEFRNG